MAEIKKVVQRVYQFDFSKCTLIDGNEMISTEHGNEFVNTFIKRDIDKGIIVTPVGYSKGMIYKTTNGGEIASPSSWFPDIINFAFNVYGLKKNSYYRLTVKAKNYRKYNSLTDVTSDRSLEVSNDNQELKKIFLKLWNMKTSKLYLKQVQLKRIYISELEKLQLMI